MNSKEKYNLFIHGTVRTDPYTGKNLPILIDGQVSRNSMTHPYMEKKTQNYIPRSS